MASYKSNLSSLLSSSDQPMKKNQFKPIGSTADSIVTINHFNNQVVEHIEEIKSVPRHFVSNFRSAICTCSSCSASPQFNVLVQTAGIVAISPPPIVQFPPRPTLQPFYLPEPSNPLYKIPLILENPSVNLYSSYLAYTVGGPYSIGYLCFNFESSFEFDYKIRKSAVHHY